MMKPVLVTGGNRTGTSWVGKLLCLSEELFYVWEPFNCMSPIPFFKHPFKRHYRRVLPEESNWVERHVRRKALYEILHRTPGGRGLVAKGRKAITVASMLAGWASGRKAPLYKDPIALMSAEWFAETFDAMVVMVARHPGAYVNSIRRLGWPMCVEEFANQPLLMDTLPQSLQQEIHERIGARPRPRGYVVEDAALCWKVFHQVIHQYAKDHPNWILVRHEDLSLNYIAGFRELYSRLSLTWTENVERDVRGFCRPENETVQGDVCHHFTQDSAELTRLWKKVLSSEEKAKTRRITEPVASLFYDDSSWD